MPKYQRGNYLLKREIKAIWNRIQICDKKSKLLKIISNSKATQTEPEFEFFNLNERNYDSPCYNIWARKS